MAQRVEETPVVRDHCALVFKSPSIVVYHPPARPRAAKAAAPAASGPTKLTTTIVRANDPARRQQSVLDDPARRQGSLDDDADHQARVRAADRMWADMVREVGEITARKRIAGAGRKRA